MEKWLELFRHLGRCRRGGAPYYRAHMKPASRALFAVVLGTFFVSGLAGLAYQVVWARYLALFLGHTSYAVVAVLVAFMGIS